MAKQTFSTGQVLTSAQMTSLQANDYNWTVSTKTASYVLAAADAGTTITMNSASATTITVNTALFTAGDTLRIANIGAGVCTVTAGTATVTTAGTLALVQWAGGMLYFTSASASIFFPDAVASASAQTVAIFNETQASGTNGGTPTASAWTKRTLNTTQTNNIASCTLSSSVVSLPAGTYLFSAQCPSYYQGARGRIQNTTAGTTLVLGMNQLVGYTTPSTAPNDVVGIATLSVTSNIELQYYATLAVTNTGLGAAQSYGVSEIYSNLMIVRIA